MSAESVMQHFRDLAAVADDVLSKLRVPDMPTSIFKVEGGVGLELDGVKTTLPSISMAYVVSRARQEKLPIAKVIDFANAYRRDHKKVQTGSTSPLHVDEGDFVPRDLSDFTPLLGELLDDTETYSLEELQQMFKEAYDGSYAATIESIDSGEDYDGDFDA